MKASLATLVVALVFAGTASAHYGTGLTQIRYANAYCESGGDPYNRHNSVYRGKWQFDQRTWNAYAPRRWYGVDPARAPEWVQDRAALAVTYDAWPNC